MTQALDLTRSAAARLGRTVLAGLTILLIGLAIVPAPASANNSPSPDWQPLDVTGRPDLSGGTDLTIASDPGGGRGTATLEWRTAWVGTRATPMAYDIANTQGTVLYIPSATTGWVGIKGANPSDWTLDNSCSGGTFQPDQVCTVRVTFTPTAAGPRSAYVVHSTYPSAGAGVVGNTSDMTQAEAQAACDAAYPGANTTATVDGTRWRCYYPETRVALTGTGRDLPDPNDPGSFEPGAPGPTGPAGRDGADGRDGRDGVDGRDGADGRDGKDGSAGRRPVVGPGLDVKKALSTRTVRGGGRVRSRLVVRNRGRIAARNVVVCDRIPPGLTFVRARGGAARLRDGRVCFRLGTVRAGGVRRLAVIARAVRCPRSRLVRSRTTATARGWLPASASRTLRVRPAAGCVQPGGVTG